MIYSTKAFTVAAATHSISSKGFTLSATTVAAYIRHNCTNYDSVSNLLSTDEAESLILATYKAVVAISPITAPAMKVWAQKKVKALA